MTLMTNDLNDQLLPSPPCHKTRNRPSHRTQQLLLLTRECINFASVIQICKLRPRQGVIFPSGGKKNLEFGMLNFELSAKPMLNYPILNWEFRIQEATTGLKNQNSKNSKFKKTQNSKIQNARSAQFKTQNSKLKKLWQ